MSKKAEKLIESLTDKQKVFCREYVWDWNATRAAKAAGYSEKAARQIGSDLLSKAYIQKYIEFIQEDIAKLSGISMNKILTELSKIAFSSIAHLHNTWIEQKDFENLTQEQKDSIESIDSKVEYRIGEDGKKIEVKYIKIKLYSKLAAIESINKMLGFNAVVKTESKIESVVTERKKVEFVKKK